MQDKYKVLRNAERFVIERKFSQAIQEYEKLLEKDSNDAGLLNTIGDLYVRVQNYPKALKRFHKVAEIYLRSGFALRAIATYKKIHSLDPSDVQVNERLSELFQKQGLNQDARRHMQFLVDHHLEKGENKPAVTWMKRIVDLDPGAWQTQIQLARRLCESDSPSEAAYYYREAVATLRNRKRFEQVLETCEEAFRSAEYEGRLAEAYAEAAERLSRIEQAEQKMSEAYRESGRPLPFKLAMALLAERRGDAEAAHSLFKELSDEGHFESQVTEGLQRTAAAAPESAADQAHDAIDLDLGADADLEDEDEEQRKEDSFQLEGEGWEDSDQPEGEAFSLEENPFHPPGEVEEVVLDVDDEPSGSHDSSSSGLFVEEEDEDAAADLGSGLFLEDEGAEQAEVVLDGGEEREESFELEVDEAEAEDQPAPSAALAAKDEEELSGEAELAAMGVLDLEEDKPSSEQSSLEPSLVDEEEAEAGDQEEDLDDVSISSLEEALEETDFYLKLGFQDEATRLLKFLLREYGGDERVLRRAKKIPGLAPAVSAQAQGEAEGAAAEGFEDELDAALDALFEGEEEHLQDEVLRYDVKKSGAEPQEENPAVHYDLGLAYKEMGLIADAAQEFRSAMELLDDGQEPLKILCCSMLANCYLNLKDYDRAIRWAREGLAIEDMKDFEWKALQYDLACALQMRGEADEARRTFSKIAAKEESYRDVSERLKELASAD
ncbi:MAG TPA: hypothetical protein VLV83_06665 [Acidobacteriota bacterium]|nr:hypothetical protein [Acidobacteriota bacterium]